MNDIKYRYIFSFAILIYFLTFLITGRIPVGEGAGWDGSVYLSYVQSLADGVIPQKDPYRLTRISAFFPAVLAAYFLNGDGNAILIFQTILNAVILSGCVCIFYATLKRLDCRNPLLWTALMFATYPFLVMPVYYPMLTDHMAIAVGCLSVWLWVSDRTKCLLALTFFSAFFHPGLFLAPLVLYALPRAADAPAKTSTPTFKLFYIFFCIISFMVALWVMYALTKLSSGEIAAHGRGVGMAQIRYISFAYAGLMVLTISYLTIKNLNVLIYSMSWTRVFIAIFAVALALSLIYYIADWGAPGFKGPPLLKFLGLQVLAAPFKPHVAHFLNFGVIFALYLIFVVTWNTKAGNVALFATSLVFLPLMSFGSETRQWIGFYPVMVAFVATNCGRLNDFQRFFFLLISLILLIPAFFIKECIPEVLIANAGFKEQCWQTYFGKQGPWMSQDAYVVGVSLLLVVLFVLLLNRRGFDEATLTSDDVMKNEKNHSQ